MKMAYKKHRISTGKLLTSLTLVFLIGFFLAFSILNLNNNYQNQEDTEITTTNAITSTVVKEVNLEGTSTTAKAKVVAVSPKGEGMVGDVSVQIKPGEGGLLVDISPFLEPDTQYSATTAVSIAKIVTQNDLKNKDVVINFNVNGTVVGGPSAGAAMTIATIAAIEDKQIKDGVAITGTIETDGTIGKVGGIVEKGDAAADQNYKTFLIPKGQNLFTYYEKQVTKREASGLVFYRTKMVQKTVNLQEYFKDRGMNVIEVSNINEAISYML
jgi:uncharacterized protein